MATETDDRTLVVERVFNTSPERLFDAFVKPQLLAQWWGPEGSTTPAHSLDVRPGGQWWTTMQVPDGGQFTCSGEYRRIEPPKRLVFTWGWRQPDGSRGHETVVDISLEPVPGGTRLTLVQKTFQNAEERDNHNKGWTSSFNDLARLFG
jgi:uncharacterized protein YndB with AHSA1/START domain